MTKDGQRYKYSLITWSKYLGEWVSRFIFHAEARYSVTLVLNAVIGYSE